MRTFNDMQNFASPYMLRFQSLLDPGRAYDFPCDAAGQVDLDALNDRARNDYFYARRFAGREFAVSAKQVSAGTC
jgi:hypothetical protein